MSKLVYGIGVNDSHYVITSIVNNKQVMCPFYASWKEMIRRCYCAKLQAKRPTYIGCSVTPEWIYFSKFKSWMETQIWENKQLDKDLLTQNNKMYSPDTCAFVDHVTNKFANEHGAARGNWPLGVCLKKTSGKFSAQCSNPFTGKREYLGYFTCPNAAHEAWKKRKHELACQLADLQTDKRVADALRVRYLL